MNPISLYRKRLIPAECVSLHADTILRLDDDILVTSWKTIRPKKDLDHGFSCYYLKEGCKISKFYRADDTLLYYYCDIILPTYDPDSHSLVITDLLADVIIYPDGFVKVCDLDELITACDNGSLSCDMLKTAILSLHNLLDKIYKGQLPELLAPLEEFNTTTKDA